ncbi:MAG: extracellular solute-binding protein [Proteobacteria bacterium]|nr:extracellular solute-binding protein [Pseudomonadota bacterium]
MFWEFRIHPNFIGKKLLLPLDLELISNYEDINPFLKKAAYITEKGKVYGVPLVHGPYGVVYNTAKIGGVDTWNDLWAPKYKKKYAIVYDYNEVNIYLTAMAMGKKGNAIWNYNALRKDKAFQSKLVALIANANNFWYSIDKAADLKGLSLATSWGFALADLKKQGETWHFGTPKEGSTGWVDNFCIARTVRKNKFLRIVAHEWLNFAISPEFQVEVGVRSLSADPANVNIKDRLTPAEIKKHHLDNLNYFKENRILWPILSKRARRGFNDMWVKALKKAGRFKK